MSRDLDTSMGGSLRNFPVTTLGLLQNLERSEQADPRRGVETLFERYWKPVYHFVRVNWRAKGNDEAKDLTQGFFLWLLDSEVLQKFEASRGSLRAFLKTLLRRYLSDAEKYQGRFKRGGASSKLSLDWEEGSLAEILVDPSSEDPEQAFDRAWKAQLTRRALSTVQEDLGARGRDLQFEVFAAYTLATDSERPTYQELADRFELKLSDIRNYLNAVREKLRRQIRRELADTVSGLGELDEEWRALFSS